MLSSLLAISALAAPLQSAPLTQAEIEKKLEAIPAFIVMSKSGQPLTATLPTRQKLLSAYMHPDEANLYLEAIKEKNSTLAAQLKVGAVNLGSLYAAINPSKGVAPYRVEYYPHTVDAQAALTMLKAAGTEVEGPILAPIFTAKLKNGNYVSSTVDGRTIIPVFFAKADVDEFIASITTAKPELRDQVSIELSNVAKLLELLKTSPASETRPLSLIPAKKSVEAAKRIIG